MASITCKHGVTHTHSSVEESKRCWQGPPLTSAPPVPASPPVSQEPAWRSKPSTPEQWARVDKEGGDATYAAKLLRGPCSDYIQSLIKGTPWRPPGQVQLAPVAPPLPPTPAPQPERRSRVSDDPRLPIIATMVRLIPEGYYATAPDGDDRHNDFVRIVTQKGKRSHWQGALTVQTQHSDRWSDPRIAFWPSGSVSTYDGGQSCIGMVQEIVADYKTAALRYSILNTRCMRCGAKLTDDRSKHYLVGPECERLHHYIWPIIFADEWNDANFEQLRHVGKPYNQHHKSLGRKAA